jgi:hypothetical protein
VDKEYGCIGFYAWFCAVSDGSSEEIFVKKGQNCIYGTSNNKPTARGTVKV